jgi:nucleoside-diphosphate-sugar epimerase
MGMRSAFVTGGSGYIGRNLIRRLTADGVVVRALARSDAAEKTILDLGAHPYRGDLTDTATMADAMTGIDCVFHLAAITREWGDPNEFTSVHVDGTRTVMQEARQAGVDTVVHVSSNSVMLDGTPIDGVDESTPIPNRPLPLYPATKALGERVALAASGDDMRVVAVRPCLVWGNDDTTLLPRFVEMIESGEFWWLGSGRQLVSTSHVDNVVEALVVAAAHGRGGQAYYVTDGPPVELRSFVTRLTETQQVTPPDRSIPARLAYGVGAICEVLWRRLPLAGSPPLTRYVVNEAGMANHVRDDLARSELGYSPVTSVAIGMERLRLLG